MAAMLLGFTERCGGQFIEQPVEHALQLPFGAGGSEFAGDFEHRIVLPVDGGSDLRSLSHRHRRLRRGGYQLTGRAQAVLNDETRMRVAGGIA